MAKKKSTLLRQIATQFTEKRMQMGMNYGQVGKASGVSRQTIMKIEACGDHTPRVNPSLKVLESISAALELKLNISFVDLTEK